MVIESLRRIIQIVFGIEIFEFPGLNRMRNFFYRLVFSIGKHAIIGRNVRLFRVHGLSSGSINIGEHVLLANDVLIDYSGKVIIGNHVWLSENVHIHTHTHKLTKDRVLKRPEDIEVSTIEIGDKAWLGDGAIILPGIEYIGENAIVGAGSVVTKNIPSNTVWAGNPAREIKKI
jgi:acetyltransferase-like isoleucine patch superfamily enzyme